jgi:hypothetical protein
LAKKRKDYRLPEETVEAIEKVRSEHGLATETEALCFIVSDYKRLSGSRLTDSEKDEIADAFMSKFTVQYGDTIRQIGFAATATEKSSYLTLNGLNTYLYQTSAQFLMRAHGHQMHHILKKAESNYEEMIADRKQRRDTRAGKEGGRPWQN